MRSNALALVIMSLSLISTNVFAADLSCKGQVNAENFLVTISTERKTATIEAYNSHTAMGPAVVGNYQGVVAKEVGDFSTAYIEENDPSKFSYSAKFKILNAQLNDGKSVSFLCE